MKDIKAVFDIGNDVIKWVVFADDDGKEIILAKQMEPTQGMRKGKILDSESFVKHHKQKSQNHSSKSSEEIS